MGAVWMRARAELRARLASAVVLVVVLGLFGGAAAAAVAGGRRTASAHPRFLEAQDSFHAFVPDFSPFLPGLFWTPDFEWIASRPYVSRTSTTTYFFTQEDTELRADHDSRFGVDFGKYVVIEGRRADPTNPEEVVVPFASDFRNKTRLGERFMLKMETPDGEGLSVPLRIVGVVAGPGHFPPAEFIGHDLIATPAFRERYKSRVTSTDAQYVWFRGGFADIKTLVADMDERSGDKVVQNFDIQAYARNVERSFQLEATALWIFGGFLGLAVALVFTQALVRHVTHGSEGSILRALGMRRGHVLTVSIIRSTLIVTGGAVIGAAVMVALSPIFPRGLARIAEPDPGAMFDAVGFAVSFVPITIFMLVSLVRPALRASSGVHVTIANRSRPSRLALVFARSGMSPAAVSGARLALEPGSGSGAVPVRSTLAAATLSLIAIVSAFTFGESLRHLLETPRLYGKTWHVSYGFNDPNGPGKNLATARAHPDVEAAATGSNGVPMKIDDVQTNALMIHGGSWSIALPTLEGSFPGEDEVLVAPRTLRALGKRVGDTVNVGLPGARPLRFRISGVGVVPPMSETMQFGEGLMLDYTAVSKTTPGAPPPDELIVRFRDGVDPVAAKERLRSALVDPSDDFDTVSPQDLLNLGRIDVLPSVLAGLLGALGLAIIGHVLVTSVTRRRRDLAVLKTIGFVRAQVRRSVAWQASIFVATAVVVAVPLGIAVGRWLWATLATQLGVQVEPVVDLLPILIAIPAALLLGNIIAAFPARAAARTQPALVLRAE